MLIRAGFQIAIHADAEMPLLLALSPHPDSAPPVIGSGEVNSLPSVPITTYRDAFGNHISRMTAPAGPLTLISDFVAEHDGSPDVTDWSAVQHPVPDLPNEVLRFLVPSRYCESDKLMPDAWRLFGATPEGWGRVQAICDFVHNHITFGYNFGRPDKSAADAYREGNGVCRDFAHLAVAFCRAMNVPARYCSGYLPDIDVPYTGPGDFSAWIEVWLGGRWHTFDARFNEPRIGRILMVRGMDAADVAMITSFGQHRIELFHVWVDELAGNPDAAALAELMKTPPPLGPPAQS